jgi:CDP-paratose 2-epimerase
MKIAIIGGAGFIGINSAYYFIERGHEVIILDNLSRVGSAYNLEQIQKKSSIAFIHLDIRDKEKVLAVLRILDDLDGVLLLAGQVAVTTSVAEPRLDFDINALGTFNVLEALRITKQKPLLIYSSTNKVYGKMEDLNIVERNNRYEYGTLPEGISEDRQLDFYSPYGCSKGAGDQYVRDYARIFDIPTVVMRQSCIYGPNQFGIEDQGWVAWFTIASLIGKKITVYGDGKQIRDVLFVTDLVRLYEQSLLNREICVGKIYNVGGGPQNTLSLNELISQLSVKLNKEIAHTFDQWRPGDQKVFVSNINKVYSELNWKPMVPISTGIESMFAWIHDNRKVIEYHVFKNK